MIKILNYNLDLRKAKNFLLTLFVIILFCFSTLSMLGAEFFLISKKQIQLEPINKNVLDEKADRKYSDEKEKLKKYSFIEGLSTILEKFPCPYAIWTNISFDKKLDFGINEDLTWRENLDLFSAKVGNYSIKKHNGFIEILWADKREEKFIRRNFAETVPPIALNSNSTEELLTMWYEVSGTDFFYDIDLIKTSIQCEKKGKSEIEELLSPQERKDMSYDDKYYISFCSEDEFPFSEFMNLLALRFGGSAWKEGGKWFIGKFRGDTSSIKHIKYLLSEIEKYSCPDYGGISGQSLIKIGQPALPEIMKAFETAKSYNYFNLVGVLAGINSPERDKVFLRELDEFIRHKDIFLSHWSIPAMMKALVENNNIEAIPIIKKIANNKETELHIIPYAKVSLNVLGYPLPERNPDELIETSDSLKNILVKEDVKKALPVFYAVLDQTFKPSTSTLELTSVKCIENGVVEFKGLFKSHKGFWGIEVATINESGTLVYAYYSRGSLWGEGFKGKLVKRNGRWLVIKWLQVMIS